MQYVHNFYFVKCRTYTRSTLESAVRTQGLQWKVPYVRKVYFGKCLTYTRFTLESAVRKQCQREFFVCDRCHRVVLNISQTTVHTQTDVVVLKVWFTFLAYLFRTCRLLPRSTYLKEVCWLPMFLMMGIRLDALNMYGRSFYYLTLLMLLYGG